MPMSLSLFVKRVPSDTRDPQFEFGYLLSTVGEKTTKKEKETGKDPISETIVIMASN